ncbi:MAG: hypothetical protein GY853_03700 [PVC group bacterium]|nr:hypothetical protein [PVC group bacterium]
MKSLTMGDKKGGSMFRKVLSVLIICSFMFSNACFAMPAAAIQANVDNMALQSLAQEFKGNVDQKFVDAFKTKVEADKAGFRVLLTLLTGNKYADDQAAFDTIMEMAKTSKQDGDSVSDFLLKMKMKVEKGVVTGTTQGGVTISATEENNKVVVSDSKSLEAEIAAAIPGKNAHNGRWDVTAEEKATGELITLDVISDEQMEASEELTAAEYKAVEAAIADIKADAEKNADKMTVEEKAAVDRLDDMLKNHQIKSIVDVVEAQHKYSFGVEKENADKSFTFGVGKAILSHENKKVLKQNILHSALAAGNEGSFEAHLDVIKRQAVITSQDEADEVGTAMNKLKNDMLKKVTVDNVIKEGKQLNTAESKKVLKDAGLAQGDMTDDVMVDSVNKVIAEGYDQDVRIPMISSGKIFNKKLSAVKYRHGRGSKTSAALTVKELTDMIKEGKATALTKEVSTFLDKSVDENGELMPNTVLSSLLTVAQEVGKNTEITGPKPLNIVDLDDTSYARLEEIIKVWDVAHVFNLQKGSAKSLNISGKDLSIIHTVQEQDAMEKVDGAFYLPLDGNLLTQMANGEAVSEIYDIGSVLIAAMTQDVTKLGLTADAQSKLKALRADGKIDLQPVLTVRVADDAAYQDSFKQFKITLARLRKA